MERRTKRKIKTNSGAAMLISVVFFLFISLAIISGLVGPTVREFKNANVNLNSKRSYFLAESGSEDAMYRVIQGMAISGNETITLNSNTVVTTIDTLPGNIKEISSLGDVQNLERTTKLSLKAGSGVAFNYGVQVGQGGLYLDSGSVTGNVNSNGPITATKSATNYITGTAISTGASGSIIGFNVNNRLRVGTVSGTTQAHKVNYVNSTGLIYCQSGTGNNKSCTAQADPAPVDFPIDTESIDQWKNEASAGGTYTGNYSVGPWPNQNVTYGPKKIVGNLSVTSGGILTVAGPIWVTGNINVTGGSQIKLASSYGANDGVVIANGTISVAGGSTATGSGMAGSYIMLLTTSSSGSAFSVAGNSGALIAYAANGTVKISGGASLREVVANRLEVVGESNVTYESGLVDNNFSSGPGGSWVVNSWSESE
jgi:hypothetical protein